MKYYRKTISLLVAFVILFSMGTSAFAVEDNEAVVCSVMAAHVHDTTCGYGEAKEAVPCDHICGEGCVGPDQEEVCTHTHGADCTYAAEEAATPCTFFHVHDELCGGIQPPEEDLGQGDGTDGDVNNGDINGGNGEGGDVEGLPEEEVIEDPLLLAPLPQITTTNFWSEQGNYTDDWEGFTGDWAVDSAPGGAYAGSNFTITSAEDLAAFCRILNTGGIADYTFEGKTVTLAADIDLAAHNWDMRGGIGPTDKGNYFGGTFDGADYTISNMTIAYEDDMIRDGSDFFGFGLFAYLYDATVCNLTIDNSQLTVGRVGPSSVVGIGGLAGQVGGSTLENVTITDIAIDTVAPANQQGVITIYFGGLVGVEYVGYTRLDPQSKPNTYVDCTVDGMTLDYNHSYYGDWNDLCGFGGMVGGQMIYGFPSAQDGYQGTITNCTVNDVTMNRNVQDLYAFAVEAYGGMYGLALTPIHIEESQVTNMAVNLTPPATATEPSNVLGLSPTISVGGIMGYANTDSDFPTGYVISNSSAQGSISISGDAGDYVYAGGLVGQGAFTAENNYVSFDFSELNGKQHVVYGNLYGRLIPASGAATTTIEDNIFNNWDYTAEEADRGKEPSPGYVGEKLSTYNAVGEVVLGVNVDLSENWGITKNILTAGVKGIPLNYVQATEKTTDMDFYDHWSVDRYSHKFLSHEADAEDCLFTQNSGKGTFPMGASVSKKGAGTPTWNFEKDIIVLGNSTSVDLKVTKAWAGDDAANRPDHVMVQLYKNGTAEGVPVRLEESNQWTHTWTGLAAADTWTVDEPNVPDGYAKAITGADTADVTITNTLSTTPPTPGDKTSVSVTKAWAGESNSNQPDHVMVQLYKNGVAEGNAISLNAGNGWAYTWSGLSGSEAWTVDELNVPDGYTKNIVGNGTANVTITNTLSTTTPPKPGSKTSVTVTKAWDHGENTERPDSVRVQLYRNGKAYGEEVSLSEKNGWSYTWNNLKGTDTWTVEEVSVQKGYHKSIVGNGTKHVTITNTWDPSAPEIIVPEDPGETPVDPEEIPTKPEEITPEKPQGEKQIETPSQVAPTPAPVDTPETGDNSMTGVWLLLAASSVLGGGAVLVARRKRVKK